MSLNNIEGKLPCREGRFALVVARFNSFICERLLEGALDTLKREGEVPEEQITVVHVPGSIEIPLTCDKLAQSGKFDAIIALGCVIRGSTYHFEVVANECAKGLSQVNLKRGVPVTNGVLTTDNLDQAVQRAGSKMGNKGSEAAASALEMVNVLRQVDSL
ncbi:MAG: 6,7-dimethyl-8-ribityllumazine synthase [Succinivibrio sp.]|nr:6,7-dimethyl-8-ribityllumazine synthase [Succinivibrio sp.]